VDCTQPPAVVNPEPAPTTQPADEAAVVKRPAAARARPYPAAARPAATVSSAPKPPVEAAPGRAAPAPARAETPEPEAAAPELHSEIDRLRLHWKQVFEQAPEEVRKTAAAAILKSAGVKPQKIDNDTVILVFRYPIHKEKMEIPENRQIAEKILSAFLGRPMRVQYVHEPEDNHLLNVALKMGAQITSVEEK
jgi:DNA polymerase-3 subunit gamma/tau